MQLDKPTKEIKSILSILRDVYLEILGGRRSKRGRWKATFEVGTLKVSKNDRHGYWKYSIMTDVDIDVRSYTLGTNSIIPQLTLTHSWTGWNTWSTWSTFKSLLRKNEYYTHWQNMALFEIVAHVLQNTPHINDNKNLLNFFSVPQALGTRYVVQLSDRNKADVTGTTGTRGGGRNSTRALAKRRKNLPNGNGLVEKVLMMKWNVGTS